LNGNTQSLPFAFPPVVFTLKKIILFYKKKLFLMKFHNTWHLDTLIPHAELFGSPRARIAEQTVGLECVDGARLLILTQLSHLARGRVGH
jgi:hypothetical protein